MHFLAYVKHRIVIYFCANENEMISVRDNCEERSVLNMLIFLRSGKKFFGRRMLSSEIGGGSLE